MPTATTNLKVAPNGDATPFASGFNEARGLAFDSSGNLFAANFNAGVINKITPSGSVSTFATGFNTPEGLAFDKNGNLFVSDPNAHAIYEVSPGGNVSTFFSLLPANGNFFDSRGLAFDSAGNLFAADFSDSALFKFGADGQISQVGIGTQSDWIAVVPGPIAGAGLPGILLAGGALLAWWRGKRRSSSLSPMLNLKDKSDLDRLVVEDVQESLTLEYKSADALGRSNQQRNELFKDVSAFANSAGGQIIYGIQENDHHPVRAQDADAVNHAEVSREWIEQVIDSNIQPRITDLRIQPIDVAPGRVAYVITIPQATASAPHQASDNKYYYRQNFQSVPMEDYQVRDLMRRSTTSAPYILLSFTSGMTTKPTFDAGANVSNPVELHVTVGNRSNQPAFHSLVMLGVDTDLPNLSREDFTFHDAHVEDGQSQNWVFKRLSSPPDFPIFKELEFRISRHPLKFGFQSGHLEGKVIFFLTTSIQTPGFSARERWVIISEAGTLTLKKM